MSEVQFLMGTQNLLFVLCSCPDKKKDLSLFLYQAQNLPSLLFLLGISLQISYLVLHLLYSSLSLTFLHLFPIVIDEKIYFFMSGT